LNKAIIEQSYIQKDQSKKHFAQGA